MMSNRPGHPAIEAKRLFAQLIDLLRRHDLASSRQLVALENLQRAFWYALADRWEHGEFVDPEEPEESKDWWNDPYGMPGCIAVERTIAELVPVMKKLRKEIERTRVAMPGASTDSMLAAVDIEPAAWNVAQTLVHYQVPHKMWGRPRNPHCPKWTVRSLAEWHHKVRRVLSYCSSSSPKHVLRLLDGYGPENLGPQGAAEQLLSQLMEPGTPSRKSVRGYLKRAKEFLAGES